MKLNTNAKSLLKVKAQLVAECFNMMNLDGYTVGGTIHLVLHNQVGFTTDQRDAFSGIYCPPLTPGVETPTTAIPTATASWPSAA